MKIVKLAEDIRAFDTEEIILLISMLSNAKEVEQAVKFIKNIDKNFDEYESTRIDRKEIKL